MSLDIQAFSPTPAPSLALARGGRSARDELRGLSRAQGLSARFVRGLWVFPTGLTMRSGSRRLGEPLCYMALLLVASSALLWGGVCDATAVSSLTIAGLLLVCSVVLLSLERNDLSLCTSLRWFIAAYSLRICFTVLVHMMGMNVHESPFMFDDEPNFWRSADPLLAAWHGGTVLLQVPQWYQRDYWAWLHIVGFVRFIGELLGGDTVLNVKLVNCAAGALIVPYVYGIANTVFDRKVARAAAGLAFLLPDYWHLSATLLRDVVVSLAIVVVVYQVLMLVYGRFQWWRLVFACFLNFGLLLYLRAYAAILVAGMAICCMLWDHFQRLPAHRFLRLLVATLAVIILILGLLVVLIPADSYQNPRNLLEVHRLLSGATDRYTVSTMQEAGEGSLGVVLLKMPFYLRVPVCAIRLLFSPIPPWGAFQAGEHINFTRALCETVAGSIWYMLLPFLAVGAVHALRYRRALSIWVWGPASIFILVLAANTGLSPRWRLMAMPFLLILVAQGWILRVRYRQWAGLVLLLIVVMLVLYILVKYLLSTVGFFYPCIMVVPGFLLCIADIWKHKPLHKGPAVSPLCGSKLHGSRVL